MQSYPKRQIIPRQRAVVAISARDEGDWIGRCLRALALQTRLPLAVLLLLNNCTDATAAIARPLFGHMPYRLHTRTHMFPPSEANAGNDDALECELTEVLDRIASKADPDFTSGTRLHC